MSILRDKHVIIKEIPILEKQVRLFLNENKAHDFLDNENVGKLSY